MGTSYHGGNVIVEKWIYGMHDGWSLVSWKLWRFKAIVLYPERQCPLNERQLLLKGRQIFARPFCRYLTVRSMTGKIIFSDTKTYKIARVLQL